jgi:hypothetical protein
MVKERRPTFVFLMEIICSKHYMDNIRRRLGFDSIFVVDQVGRSGGLAFLWNLETNLEVYNYSRRHINVVVKDGENNPLWKLTGFYGHPDCARRAESWELLKFLNTCHLAPWLCAGDFNEIVEQAEKEGSNLRKESQMTGFREAIEFCRLGDLGFSGSMFTWSNRRADGNFTKERLDRAMANPEWCSIFPSFSVLIMVARTSDHSPILVSFSSRDMERQCQGSFRRGFKFEASWTNDMECGDVISSAWNNGITNVIPSEGIQMRLSACQRALLNWSRHKYGKVEDNIKRKSVQLAALQQNESPALATPIKTLQREIEELLEFEDLKWKQRAKQHWLWNGDRNTTFFHSWVQHRRKINRIWSIADEQGRIWRKDRDIGRVLLSYYEELFTSQSARFVEDCTNLVDTRVTNDMNNWLLHSFSEEEVQKALFQMHPLKSPGPDGYLAVFYQKNWTTVGRDVCKAMLFYLNGGQLDEGINMTTLF